MKLIDLINSEIWNLQTQDQRWAAEAVADLLEEGAISEREARRQLATNGINL